ncbi:response regulator transcription factor [Metallumcola ferriviriculae]|uniref:Stage 0 sporulation protein A homolog n=1 Tax=Metallumcola ferriviriculae TaxID=3039180 RepID=A0AAU0UIG9_9FIRM|nr:response regulator transcription factor [Desulfitibacteraceae bacterium MK1]
MEARILIIDDDSKITNFLTRSLKFEGYQVLAANDGITGLNLAEEHRPDLIILDVMMPGMDGIEVCRQLRKSYSVPILMLTAKDEVSDRVKGLDAGADDYLVKPFSLEELLARVRAQLRRHNSLGNRLSFADISMDDNTREVTRNGRAIALTATEYQLLQLFLTNPRQVLTKEQIMERVWGYDYSGESNVLEVYVNMLRQKLEEAGEPRLIQTVRGVGYILKGEE